MFPVYETFGLTRKFTTRSRRIVREPASDVTGYHYTGAEAVGKVEVSTDNGATYQRMPLPAQPDPDVWVTWELTFRPPEPGFNVLHIRASSASGRAQDFPGTVAVEVR